MKRVLVAAPICSWMQYCWDQFSSRLQELTYAEYDLFFVDNSKDYDFFQKVKAQGLPVRKTPHLWRIRDMVTRDHNIIREKVLEERYDYLLILDQDVVPPKDVIEKLLAHEKDVVSALFFGPHEINNEIKVMPFAWVFSKEIGDWNHTGYLLESEIWEPKLLQIAFAGMGCILIKREVLEKVELRRISNTPSTEDILFCSDARPKGYKTFLHTEVLCKHGLKTKEGIKYIDAVKHIN